MARYQTILAYDGTHFLGLQRSGSLRTVQGEVEAALRRLGWQGQTILYAGRTDTGVHASGQVIAFDLEWSHTCGELLRALNANLPEDIAVKALQEAAADFHPRYHATRRCYQYRIFCQPQRDPLKERYAWRVWPAVDEQRLHEAARLLLGIHDFAAFGTPPRTGGSTVRMIYDAVWKLEPQGLLFEVAANAFLYHMVRRLVFLQVQVGQNRLDLKQLALAVETAQPQTPGLAPPHGLVLVEVNYPEDGKISD
jgi:tRNA pseudouridine38-40 synthase